MKKTLKYVYMAVCGIFTLFILSGSGCAAPSFNTEAYRPQSAVNDAKQWPIAQQYQQEGEVWPPVAGRYERKNPHGLTNAYINVCVLPDRWPVINLHACEYNGPNNEHGWEALDTNPGIWLGGTINPAQTGLAARFVIGAKTIGMYRGNGIREALPQQKVFLLNGGVKSLKNRIIVDYPGECVAGLPDIRGEYVLNRAERVTNDEYAAFALVECMTQRETKTDFFDKNLQIKAESITEREAAGYRDLVGEHGFAIRVFQNGSLLRSFVVPHDLNAVYRFESDGSSVMIYNIDGSSR